ncbi:MAG: ATP-binding protein, partial [Planctomycetota bacterium]
MTGYQASGKSVAVAEYADSHPWNCFWHLAHVAERQPAESADDLLLSLASFLDARSVAHGDVRHALQRVLDGARLLVVIDNAHLVGYSRSLDLIFGLAGSASNRLHVVFVGLDEPEFLKRMRGKTIPIWRLPGMSRQEARTLYGAILGGLSPHQETALNLLRTRCDGHIGLLKLAANDIRDITDAENLESFSRATVTSLAGDASQLHALLVSRFRDSLSEESFQLCRRLSVTLGPFPKRLARALWNADQPPDGFAHTWNACVVGAMEAHTDARYSLPDLYHDGLRDYTQPDEVTRWHAAAADELNRPVGNVLNAVDLYHAVIHRCLSGALAAALDGACAILGLAVATADRAIQRFFLDRFQVWLAKAADDPTVPMVGRVRWYTIRTRLCWDIGQSAESDDAAETLFALLTSEGPGAPEADDGVAWLVLLVHASLTGRPEIATRALENVPFDSVEDDLPSIPAGTVFLALSAFLQSDRNPLGIVQQILDRPSDFCRSRQDLWHEEHGYGLWRAVGSAISLSVEQDAGCDRSTIGGNVTRLAAAVESARTAQLNEIAVLLPRARRSHGSSWSISRPRIRRAVPTSLDSPPRSWQHDH